MIASQGGNFLINIVDHFTSGKRIELFQFQDGLYGASFLEVRADQNEQQGVYFVDGWPYIPGGHNVPVVLDFNGDGVKFLSDMGQRLQIDVDGDRKRDATDWIDGNDALLVLDRNGNGRVDLDTDISFLGDLRGAGSDLEGLLSFDDNGDGYIDGSDSIFAQLQLWFDVNQNGRSERQELFTLEQHGVSRIGLEILEHARLRGDNPDSQILGYSTVEMISGVTIRAYDVAFAFDTGAGDIQSQTIHESPSGMIKAGLESLGELFVC